MPDAVLQFIKPSSTPTESNKQKLPVQWMHGCLKSARQIEEMAVQMDSALADRDAKISEAKANYQLGKTQTDARYRKSMSDAELARSNTKYQAETEQERLTGIAGDALQRCDLPFVWPLPTDGVTESAATLESRLKSASEIVAARKASRAKNKIDISDHPWAWGCGGLVALWVICALVGGMFQQGGGYAFTAALILLGVPTFFIWRAISQANLKKESLRQVADTAKQLILRSKTDHEQTTAASETSFNQSVTQAEALLKQEEQAAQKQRDKTVSDCQSATNTLCVILTAKMNGAHVAVDQDIKALSQGVVHGKWSDAAWRDWEPTQAVPGCLRIGTVVPDMPRFRFHFSDKPPLAVPALVDYEAGKGVVISAGGALTEARQMAQSAILRLLATVPPASVRFVMIDPVSLGGNVAGFMALEKYEASLVGGKAWSDARHIEQALTEVTEHMETVIQKYLREDYKTIAEYNAKARVKEAYRVVVIFDFPVNFTEGTAKRLISIMRNGPRCGVFPIIVADNTKPLPYGVSWNDLTQFAMVLQPSDAPAVVLADEAVPTRQGTAPSSQGVVDDYYDDDEEDEDE